MIWVESVVDKAITVRKTYNIDDKSGHEAGSFWLRGKVDYIEPQCLVGTC